MTSFKWIVGGLVIDITQTMQVLQAFVIGSFGTYFTYRITSSRFILMGFLKRLQFQNWNKAM